jgi:hypothetical protein
MPLLGAGEGAGPVNPGPALERGPAWSGGRCQATARDGAVGDQVS